MYKIQNWHYVKLSCFTVYTKPMLNLLLSNIELQVQEQKEKKLFFSETRWMLSKDVVDCVSRLD